MSCADETVKIIGRMLEAERAGAKFPAPHEPGFDVCETVQLGSYAGMPLFEVIGMDGDSRMQVCVREDGSLEEMACPVLPDVAGRNDELKPAVDPEPRPGMGAIFSGYEHVATNWRAYVASIENDGDPVDDALRILAEYVRLPYGRKLGREEEARGSERAAPRNREMMQRVLNAGTPAGVDAWLRGVYGETLRLLRTNEPVLALWHTIHPAAAPDGPGPVELNEWRQGLTNAIQAASELASDSGPPTDVERRDAACEPRVGAREGRVPGLVSRIEDAQGCLRQACLRVAHEQPVSVRRDIEGALRWLATALEEAGALRDELPAEAHVCTCDHVEGCEGCAPDFGARCQFEALLRQQLASRYPIERRSDADEAGSS